MKVLIAGGSNLGRGGMQTHVRNLAIGLTRMGHDVLFFHGNPNRHSSDVDVGGVPVCADLEALPFAPDIIHTHQQLTAMCAVAALPDAAAIYHNHGALWHHAAPKHPRIRHYLTVSETAKERMMVEAGVSPERITVFPNPVDLARFHRVRELPAQPRRALFFNSRHDPKTATVRAVQEAARRRGLELDLVGFAFGSPTDVPEGLLGDYDIVFASGQCAIEAMASGCAVILLGRNTCGEMVLPEKYGRYRSVNFSMPAGAPVPAVDAITAEIGRYAPDRCASVTASVRRDADLRTAIARLVEIYEAALEQHRRTPRNLEAEMKALSRHLRRNAPVMHLAECVATRRWSTRAESASLDELATRTSLIESVVCPDDRPLHGRRPQT